jgi:hypothetical protein
LPAVYRIAPGLAVAFALTVVAAEQATPLSSVVLLLAALLLPYRLDRRGRPPIMSYLPGERSVRAERSAAT